jgi:hypothetical protein
MTMRPGSLPPEDGSGSDSARSLLIPWRRADSIEDIVLLWMPCQYPEMPLGQRDWFNLFLDRWLQILASEHGLADEFFVQMETIQGKKKLADRFYENLITEQPLMGRSISSLRETPKGVPAEEETKLLISGKTKYDYRALSAPRACWLRGGDHVALRAAYLGYGGSTILLLPRTEESQEREKGLRELISMVQLPAFMSKNPEMVRLVAGLDPERPLDPPAFIKNHPARAHFSGILGQKRNPEQLLERTIFGKKTKELFGDSLKTTPGYQGIPFVLPRFSSAEFFRSTAEERASWFQLFDVYLRESPEDNGLLLAAKPELLPGIVNVVNSLREDGYRYWEG